MSIFSEAVEALLTDIVAALKLIQDFLRGHFTQYSWGVLAIFKSLQRLSPTDK